MVHAFISSRLDYCNSLLFGISDNLLQRLQASGRLATGTRRRELITPVLRQLHWLPMRQRIEFELAVQSDEWPVSRHIWRTTASLPLPPADDDFDHPTSPHVRFQELAQVWVIAHSLLLDRVCGATYLTIYMILNLLFCSSAGTAAPSDCLLFARRRLPLIVNIP